MSFIYVVICDVLVGFNPILWGGPLMKSICENRLYFSRQTSSKNGMSLCQSQKIASYFLDSVVTHINIRMILTQ